MDIDTKDSTCHQERVGNVVTTITTVNQSQTFQLAKVFFDSQVVRQHLSWCHASVNPFHTGTPENSANSSTIFD